MGDSEILIKIKTILESQGIDAAKKEIAELINATNAHDIAAAESAQGISASRIEMEKATKAAFALRMAASGSTEGFRGLAATAFQFGNAFGAIAAKATIVFAAFSAGWKIGDVIRSNLIDPLVEFRTKNLLPEMIADFDKLNKKKLDGLKEQVEGVKKSLTDSLSKLDEVASRTELLRSAIADRLSAEAAATPEGPERDRAINEDTLRAEQEKYIQTRQSLKAKQETVKAARGNIEKGILAPAQEGLDNAEKSYEDTRTGSTESKVIARHNYEAAKERFNTAKEGLQPVIDSKISEMTANIEAELIANEERMKTARVRYESTLSAIADREKSAAEQKLKEQAESDKKQQNELRIARLALLKESFAKETDAQKLPQMAEEISALEIAGLSQENPEARDINKNLIIDRNQQSLTSRFQDIAVDKAGKDVATDRDKLDRNPNNAGAKLDLSTHQKTLEDIRNGNVRAIAAFVGLAEGLIADQNFLANKIATMERRESISRGASAN